MKIIFKIAIAAFFLWLFVIPRVTAFNDSYEENFCKHYGQWNKYSWAVRNQNSENWENLEASEYSKLQEIVQNDSPDTANLLTRTANQWFQSSEQGDVSTGVAMAAYLVVQCEDLGVRIDRQYLR